MWQNLRMTSSLVTGFQSPQHITDLESCYFYHSIDLPGFGLQVGHWDLRDSIDAYLGHQPLRGRRVVDVGAASGYVSLEMERRGAEVISFDRLPTDTSDEMGLLPYADFEARFGRSLEQAIQERIDNQRRLQNSFWLAHRLFQSKNRLYCNNVYEGMVGVDSVDVSFFGCILLHLRDPLLALRQFARITRETLIITDTLEKVEWRFTRWPMLLLRRYPLMVLRPTIGDRDNIGTWWWTTPPLYRSFLEIMGFTKFTYTESQANHVGINKSCDLFTLVARR